MAKWRNASYPDGCRHCGTTERVSMGRGLCSRCYQDETVKDLYGPVREGAMDDDQVDDQAGAEDLGAELPPEPPADPLGGGPLGEDEMIGTRERRPGGYVPPEPEAESSGPKRGFRSIFAKKAPKVEQSAPTKEKRPKTSKGAGRRVSAADSLADLWSAGGSMMMRSGHVPTGRMLQFQSAVAGEMLDEAVKGSIIDKVALQPIVKARGRFDLVGAVFGPPLIVFAMERDPSRAPMLMPALRSSIRQSLPLMVPAIKKVQEKERKAAEAAAELFPDLPPGEDPVDAIIASLFDNWVPPAPAEEPDETPAEEYVI